MPKTHEILNGKRKGHPNLPSPRPKIVQWVKKKIFLLISLGNVVFNLTGEKQSQTQAKITVETEALLTFVAICLFQWRIWRWMTAALRNPTTWATRSRKFYISRTANSLMGLKLVGRNRHRDWSLADLETLTADRITMFIVISFTKQAQFLFAISIQNLVLSLHNIK